MEACVARPLPLARRRPRVAWSGGRDPGAHRGRVPRRGVRDGARCRFGVRRRHRAVRTRVVRQPPDGRGRCGEVPRSRADRADRDARMNGRRVTWRVWLPYALVVGSALLIGYVGGAPDRGGAPLDPTSAAPDGTKALVDTLRALGVEVTVGPAAPNASTTTALLLSDRLVDAQIRPVDDWVRAGGTLVVADPSSHFSITRPTGRTLVGFIEPELERRCDEPALRDVDRVLVPNGQLLRVPKGAFGCFTEGSTSAFLVSAPVGRGRVVQLGGAGGFINSRLGKVDNGLLAATLLAPRRDSRVAVLQPAVAGDGAKSLTDLVSPRVKLALLQLAIAFGIVVLWRARRLGRPVLEVQPVHIAGSELVAAVGNLLQRAKGRPRAAALLRDDLRRTLADRLGLPPDTPPDRV